MAFCSQCGQRFGDDTVRFCGACGAARVWPRELVVAAPPSGTTQPGPAGGPTRRPATAARRRRPGWRTGTALVATGVAVVVGALVHLTVGGVGPLHADGVPEPVAQRAAAASTVGGGDDVDGSRPDSGSTSVATACGRVLDLVPTRAVARRGALEVDLEVLPVCPEAEVVDSAAFDIRLEDADGIVLADATFDLSARPVTVPAFGDPSSLLVARFAPGTAWTAPDSLAERIADGTVVVACRSEEGETTEDGGRASEPGDDAGTGTSTVEVDSLSPTTTRAEEARTALAALRRQAEEDDAEVSDLEGAWVPQLSSKQDGTYDAYDDKTYTLADIYQQFLVLRLEYPEVRLLNSSDWSSFRLSGYWVVVAGVPFTRSGETNQWCARRGIASSQCFAKKLLRGGSDLGTTRLRS